MHGVDVLGYIGAGGLLVIAPGPDFVVVMRSGLGGGRRAASAAGLGVATGFLVWSIVVATGLGAVLATSAGAYTVIKVVGIAYLLYLGAMSLASARRGDDEPDGHDDAGGRDGPPHGERSKDGDEGPVAVVDQQPPMTSFRQGVLTNVLNPKVAVTFLSLMPQFLPHSPSGAQLALLCMVTFGIGLVWFQSVAVMVGALRRVFARARVRRWLDAVTGTILVALGLRLAVE